MSKDDKSPQDYQKEFGWNYEDHLKHWRSWGSWFSWGSPVGLGLFFISVGITIWIIVQAFGK